MHLMPYNGLNNESYNITICPACQLGVARIVSGSDFAGKVCQPPVVRLERQLILSQVAVAIDSNYSHRVVLPLFPNYSPLFGFDVRKQNEQIRTQK